MYIQFFPTFRCNETCSFCFNRGISRIRDISAVDFGKVADVLAGEGIEEIDFLGGEPTCHPELTALVETACNNGLRASISSNGSNVRALTGLSHNFEGEKLTIGISLNGTPVDDELVSYILEYRPLIKSVCNRTRFMPETVQRLIGHPGIRYYAIFMDALQPSDLDSCLPFPQYYRRLNKLRKVHRNVEGVYCSCYLPDTAHEDIRCPAGTTKLSVMPDGSVYPCYLLFQRPEFRLGNILSDDIDRICRHPALSFFRNFERNHCPETVCELHGKCRGGCPAVSLMVCDDLVAPDPRCLYGTRNLTSCRKTLTRNSGLV